MKFFDPYQFDPYQIEIFDPYQFLIKTIVQGRVDFLVLFRQLETASRIFPRSCIILLGGKK